MYVPKLRFKEFNGQWNYHKLGEIVNVSSASRVHKEEWTTSGVRFFRSSDVTSAYKGTENQKAFISNGLYEKLIAKSGKVSVDDVLVTGGGSVGIPYLVNTDEPIYFKDADLVWIKNSGIINGYFLYTFFIAPLFRRYIKSISHVGTISHYTIEQVKDTPIQLPLYNEQNKIGEFFKVVDKKIQLQQEKIDLLKEQKKGFMQKIFSQELRFKDKDGQEFPEWKRNSLEKSGTLSWDSLQMAVPTLKIHLILF
ncbi:restriction endonuclease subunit S [Cytobacillus praedii]|uniref:restriction endonuclease subunit S n=1 Tax=Cytobacillus praedii TaxID=1742358 RepID=UPI002E24ABAD|nr:restriction endonuclease subunit S [Cytobacillus praedii]MED3552739.1 restriction endonuclease subunit S [Cytobacillus praedii]